VLAAWLTARSSRPANTPVSWLISDWPAVIHLRRIDKLPILSLQKVSPFVYFGEAISRTFLIHLLYEVTGIRIQVESHVFALHLEGGNMSTNGVNHRKGMNSGVEDIEADLNRIKSSGALTITPELFEKVLYKIMSLRLGI
jgi:hypothetical protein